MTVASNPPNADSQPELRTPGWKVRVYVESSPSQGRNALEKAILGLIRVGVPGISGSLARELSIEERVVEIALNGLEDEGLLELHDDHYGIPEGKPPADEQVIPTQGWMFWDALRRTFLPVLVLDGHSDDSENSDSGGHDDELEKFRTNRPSHEEIRRDFMSAVENRDLVLLGPPSRSTSSSSIKVSPDDLRRVSPMEGRGSLRWHPLFIPYQINPTLGEDAEIHFLEPVYRAYKDGASSYSPYLKSVIEAELPCSLERINEHAADRQTRFLTEQGAPFLEARGGAARVSADALDAVRRMLGGRIPAGSFNSAEIVQAARDAETTRMMVEPLNLSVESVRTPFSRILQIIGRIVADDLKPRWLRQQHKLRGNGAWGRYKRSSQAGWEIMLREFDRRHHTAIKKWNTAPPFDHLRKASNPHYLQLSGLGTVLRSWGALAVAADGEPDGLFCIAWIRATLREFPEFFEVFDEIKTQRNMDKNSSSIGISAEEYRRSIYRVWSAIGRGHQTAIKELQQH